MTTPKSNVFSSLLIFLLLLFSPIIKASAKTWQTLAPGIEYQDLIKNPLTPWAHIYVFRIDLQHYQLDLVTAKELSKEKASIDILGRKNHALIAINGGFFDQRFHPLGLRINQQQEHNPVKRISWWGIFFIKHQMPYLISSREYSPDNKISFAIQTGPRLIINGHIPSLKPGIAERSALGITAHNKLIMLVTNNAMITTTELAHLMKAPPLNCDNALNLDGGSSSQLFTHLPSFHLNVRGFSDVSDAIVVKPRQE